VAHIVQLANASAEWFVATRNLWRRPPNFDDVRFVKTLSCVVCWLETLRKIANFIAPEENGGGLPLPIVKSLDREGNGDVGRGFLFQLSSPP
jgi:hypothetical protein